MMARVANSTQIMAALFLVGRSLMKPSKGVDNQHVWLPTARNPPPIVGIRLNCNLG
jgi:hypothetical protein